MDFIKYVIIDTADGDLVNYKDPYVKITSKETALKSVDGTRMIVKYLENKPTSIQAIESCSQEYTKEQIQTILQSAEWYVEPTTE